MKKILSIIGMISLIYFNFFISNRTTMVVRELDDIMKKIEETKGMYEIPAVDATINGKTIIPGLNGKKINIEKSYNKMKQLKKFNPNYFVYENVKPNSSIRNQYEKIIISGNQQKNMVSLVFVVNNNDKIDSIIQILTENQVKGSFFIDGSWFEKNNELVLNLIEEGHTIGNLSYNLNYKDSGFVWINNILKKIGKQNQNYCYITNKEEDIEICALQKNYIIQPNIIIDEKPLIEIKEKLTAGSIISLQVNDKTKNELNLIIKYIKSKGYNLENIETHLSEKNNY